MTGYRGVLDNLCLPFLAIDEESSMHFSEFSEDDDILATRRTREPPALLAPAEVMETLTVLRKGFYYEQRRIKKKIHKVRHERSCPPKHVPFKIAELDVIERHKYMLQLQFLENQLEIRSEECEMLQRELAKCQNLQQVPRWHLNRRRYSYRN